jgi:hypothetical protein
MTIDDELILELIKPNRLGEVKGGFICKVVRTTSIRYILEEPFWFLRGYECEVNGHSVATSKDTMICPDIVVTLPKEENKQIAVELEMMFNGILVIP